MDYFWKENRTYLIAVAAGIAVAIAYHSCVLSGIRAETEDAARKLHQEERDLRQKMAAGVPGPHTLETAPGDLARTRQLLSSLKGDLSFKVGDRFAPPTGESAKSHYDNLKIKLFNELRELSVNKHGKPYPPNLGLDPAGDDVPEDLAEELLDRLAVVDRLTRLALESGVAQISAIDVLDGADPKDQPVRKKGAFLSRLSVRMDFKGESQAGFKVLHGLQKKGAYLAVTDFKAAKDDPTKDLFTFSVRVALLRVDEGAPIVPKAEPAP